MPRLPTKLITIDDLPSSSPPPSPLLSSSAYLLGKHPRVDDIDDEAEDQQAASLGNQAPNFAVSLHSNSTDHGNQVMVIRIAAAKKLRMDQQDALMKLCAVSSSVSTFCPY